MKVKAVLSAMSLFRVLVFLIPILLIPITSEAKQTLMSYEGSTVVVDSFRFVGDQYEIIYNGRVLKGPADQLSAVIAAIAIQEQENNRNQKVPEQRELVAEQRKGESQRVSQQTVGVATSVHAGSKAIPDDVKYSIISEKKVPTVKRALDIRLNKKVSPEVLKAIALELKQLDRNTYQRTFILYYLPEMEIGAGAWASAHFNPDLEVKIYGLTTEEETNLRKPSAEPQGKILGEWLCDQPFVEGASTLYVQDGRVYMKTVYKDGSSGTDEMVEKKSERGRRFQVKGGSAVGEYYLINTYGLLELWTDMGRTCTCKKIKK